MQKNFRFRFRHVLYIVLLSGFTVAIAQPLKNKTKAPDAIKASLSNDIKANTTKTDDKTDAERK